MQPINQRNWVLKDERLTPNFRLYEFIHWADKMINMSDKDKQLANQLAEENFEYKHYIYYKAMAHFLQGLRDRLNEDGDYGIIVTCAYRPEEWERYRRRTGSSQHTECAVDFVIFNRNTNTRDFKKTEEVFDVLNAGRFNGGLAVKYIEDAEGNRIGAAFCHVDFGPFARWEY